MGEVFAGRYELIDMIGEGGMGAVWRVRDLKRERIIAAKVLRQSDAGSLLRFMREQGMRIHHPHVVTPLGWAGEDDKVLFTMPIVEGGSVSTLMRDFGPLPTRFAAELLRQMLRALDAVHSAGIVHRDIKPANLLLDATGAERPHLWLTDFGVALAVGGPRLTSMSVVMGTPGYLAPEQLRGAEPDPVSDLYAAGMVGFQLVTGHRPAPQLRSARLDLPPRPTQTPPVLWDLLVRLADPDPGGRPPSARAALQILEHPDLAWQDQREVEVFRHMPDLPGVSEGEFLRPGEDGVASAPSGTQQLAADGTAAMPAASTRRQPVAPEPTGGFGQRPPAATQGFAQGGATRGSGARAGTAPFTGAPQSAGTQHSATQHSTTQHSTAPHSATQHSTAPHSATQDRTVHDSGSTPAARRGSGKGPLAVLIAAPLLALLAIALIFFGPWAANDPPTDGQPVVQNGGVCGWWDAGTAAQDSGGAWLRCTQTGSQFRWQVSD